MAEVCENCGASIGKLETPRVHQDHVVCTTCWQKLSSTIGYSHPQAPVPTRETTTANQRKAAILACAGVPFLMIGMWMLNASGSTNAYSHFALPGGICLFLGGGATLVGLLVFAIERMRG